MSDANGRLTPRWTYFVLAYCISWCAWIVPVLASHGVIPLPPHWNTLFEVVGAFGPFVACFICLYLDGGWTTVREFALRCLRWRIRPVCLLPAIFLAPVLAALAVYIYAQFGGSQLALAMPLGAIPLTFVLLFFLGGSVDEEFGWAYAIDRLLTRFRPLPAAVILGILWGFWHLPLFFIAGTTQFFVPLWMFLILTVSFRTLFVWAYESTGKSILVTLLFHTSVNMAFSLVAVVVMKPGVPQTGFLIFAVLALACAIGVVLSSKLYRNTMLPERA